MTTNQKTGIIGLLAMGAAGVLLLSGGEPPGPPGIIGADCGLVLVMTGTNRTPAVIIRELITTHQHVVGRYIHDRDVYGDSVFLDPGFNGAPLDIPKGHMIFSKSVSAAKRYAIEHSPQ